MKNISKHFINCIKDKDKRQKYFALFAFIFSICYQIFTKNNNTEIIKSVVTAAVAAGGAIAASAGGGAAAGGAAAAGSAAAGSAAAGSAAAGSAAAGSTAAGSAAAGSTAAGSTAAGGQSAAKAADLAKSTNKNTSELFNNASSESPKSNASAPSNTNKKNKGLRDLKNDLTPNESTNEDENEDSLQEESTTITNDKKSSKNIFGCILFLPLILFIIVPILSIMGINNLSSSIGNINCSGSNSTYCDDKEESNEDDVGFFEKIKNLILNNSYEVGATKLANEAVKVYDDIYEKMNVKIDVPLLLATVMNDVSEDEDEISISEDENGNKTQTKVTNAKLKSRIKYLEELGELQVSSIEVIFTCKAVVSGDNVIYYKETDYSGIDSNSVEEGECNEENVEKTLKETAYGLDIEGYYDRLKENSDILVKIYGSEYSDEEMINGLLEEIREHRDLFTEIYEDDIDETGSGNIPLTILYDSSVNFQTPLKGSYYITSPYGKRTGLFAGRHKGIDVVCSNSNIYAAGDGIVTNVYTENLGGNVIEITHIATDGSKYVTQYAHLSKFLVSKGDVVYASDTIGIMGKTGDTSGVHLHFQMWEVTTGKTYNPLNLFVNAINYPSQNI